MMARVTLPADKDNEEKEGESLIVEKRLSDFAFLVSSSWTP